MINYKNFNSKEYKSNFVSRREEERGTDEERYIKEEDSSSSREDKFELYGFFVSLTVERFQPQAN